jgi:hypothetical protein
MQKEGRASEETGKEEVREADLGGETCLLDDPHKSENIEGRNRFCTLFSRFVSKGLAV